MLENKYNMEHRKFTTYNRTCDTSIKKKADWFVTITHYRRERTIKGEMTNKTTTRKNIRRLTRLFKNKTKQLFKRWSIYNYRTRKNNNKYNI